MKQVLKELDLLKNDNHEDVIYIKSVSKKHKHISENNELKQCDPRPQLHTELIKYSQLIGLLLNEKSFTLKTKLDNCRTSPGKTHRSYKLYLPETGRPGWPDKHKNALVKVIDELLAGGLKVIEHCSSIKQQQLESKNKAK